MKKFYAVVGNPPYQEDSVGDNESYARQIYNLFLDETYKVGDRVEMVHPALRKRGTAKCCRILI